MLEKIKPLLRILGEHREFYPIIAVYSVCISVLTLATPISVQSLINTFSFGPYLQPLFILSLMLLSLLVILGLLKSLQYLVVEYLQRRLYAKVTSTLARAYIIDSNLEEKRLQEKANRYFDVVLVQKTLAYLVTDGIAVALQTFFGLVLIGLYHPYFIIFGFMILISLFLPLWILGTHGLYSSVEESTGKYKVADFVKTLVGRGPECSATDIVEKTDLMIGDFLDRRAKHFRVLFTQNIIYITQFALLNAFLLALGGYLVIKNQLSVGQLVAAEIVVNSILSHFLYAKKYLESFYDMYGASEKLNVFYELVEEKPRSSQMSDQTWNSIVKPGNEQYFSSFSSLKKVYAPTNYKTIIRNFCFGTAGIVFVFFISPWQQTSRGYGQVTAFNPNDRAQFVTATVTGLVEEWLVQDGQEVKKGDPIVRVVDNDPNYMIRLEARRDAAVAKFEAAREASDTARLNFRRQEKLVEEGLSAPKDFELAKIKYKKLLAEEAEAAAGLAKAEVDFSRQQLQVVTAPRDGRILRILLGSGTTNVKVGEKLVEFVPDTEDHAVELFIDGNDLPLVYKGRKVRLQFEGWPSVQFSGWPSVAIGSFGGIVSVVDPSVSKNGQFRVIVKPDKEDMPWPDQRFLRQGARTVGLVLLDRVTLGYEFWRQINGFPKSMDEAPEVKDKTYPKVSAY